MEESQTQTELTHLREVIERQESEIRILRKEISLLLNEKESLQESINNLYKQHGKWISV